MQTAPKPRYFLCNDNGCKYWVVASDSDHAERILLEASIDFDPLGEGEDGHRPPTWTELGKEEASKQQILIDASDSVIMSDGTRAYVSFSGNAASGHMPLTSFGVGEWFASEV